MINNFWFEAAAFALELAIGYMLVFRKSITLTYSRIFRKLYLCSFISSFVALSYVFIESYIHNNSKDMADFIVILNILSMIFFYAHTLCCAFAAFYEYSVLNIKINETLSKFLLYTPAVVAVITITLNPFFHTVFYISPVSGYHRRLLLYLLYFVALYYLAFVTLTIYNYGQNIRNDKRIAFTVIPVIPLIGTTIQFFYPSLAVESFFMALMVLIIYITIESPSDYIDSVTGLLNKDALFTNFSVAISMRKPITVLTLTIEMIDALDKELEQGNINNLIIEVSSFLSHLLKSASLYSLGRGKFAICFSLENYWSNIHMTEILIDRIEERFKYPFEITSTNKISLTKRLCIYNCPNDIDNAGMLKEVIQLEATAVIPKDRGYITINDMDITIIDKEHLISSKILNLYEKPALYLTFLPELNVSTNKFDSLKTEIILETSEIGNVNSRTFISIAEKYGLITGLYNFLLEMLFKSIRDNYLMTLGIKTIEVIIPISILLKKNEVEKLVNLAAKYDIPPKLICFELSNSSMIDYDGVIIDNMKSITDSGFRFILENYGNGYTNASALVDMPISLVTIDKVLTKAALDSELARNLVNCTIDFLREFKLQIKAEHIETVDSLDYALNTGFDYLQGYYFSKPLSVDDLTVFLKKEVI